MAWKVLHDYAVKTKKSYLDSIGIRITNCNTGLQKAIGWLITICDKSGLQRAMGVGTSSAMK